MSDLGVVGVIIGIIIILMVGVYILIMFDGASKIVGIAMVVGGIIGLIVVIKNA